MKGRDSSSNESPAGASGRLREIARLPEGKVFFAGVLLACLHLGVIALTRLRSAELFQNLLSMTGTHILGGRAAAISWGYVHNLPGWLVMLAAMSVETFAVLLFYPLFFFSYRKLIAIEPLKESLDRAQRAAMAYQPKIMKYGIPGLLLFVWFPFWMTGPLVGSVIGFLIGLRLKVNLAVVLSGTYLAILSWSFVLSRLLRRLSLIGPYIPLVLVGLVLLFAVSIRIRYAFSPRAHQPVKDENEKHEGAR